MILFIGGCCQLFGLMCRFIVMQFIVCVCLIGISLLDVVGLVLLKQGVWNSCIEWLVSVLNSCCVVLSFSVVMLGEVLFRLGWVKVWLFMLWFLFIMCWMSCGDVLVFLLMMKNVVGMCLVLRMFRIFGVQFGFGLLLKVRVILFGWMFMCWIMQEVGRVVYCLLLILLLFLLMLKVCVLGWGLEVICRILFWFLMLMFWFLLILCKVLGVVVLQGWVIIDQIDGFFEFNCYIVQLQGWQLLVLWIWLQVVVVLRNYRLWMVLLFLLQEKCGFCVLLLKLMVVWVLVV